MSITVTLASNQETLPLRVRLRAEVNSQIVHDSIHTRDGWCISHLIREEGRPIGFGSIAVAGPWKGRPTLYEFYLIPEARGRAFECFEALVAVNGARFFEVQTSESLLNVMLHTYGSELESEKIVFRDELATSLPAHGALMKRVTSESESMTRFLGRGGQSEWVLQLDGTDVGHGSILFHYNFPFCDLAMEVSESYRRRGYGSYLVQELKRITYEMGGIPAARCNPSNHASRNTLQKAGLVPFAHIVLGKLNIPSATSNS